MARPACLLLLLTLACARAAPRTDFETHMATALATRAEELLQAGETARARRAAEDALARAVASGSRAAEARALHVLGLLDGDERRLQRALLLLESQPPSPALWQQRAVLAELALERDRPLECLRLVEPSLRDAADWPAPEPRARAQAALQHLRAAALRRLDRADEAFAAQRQAALAVSVLDAAEELALRRAVAQALGDDHAARADWQAAFEHHARASALSRSLGQPREEFLAVRGMSRDLAGMGRLLDAADQARRGLDLAGLRVHLELARALGHEALDWLADDTRPAAADRRAALRAALAALDAAPDAEG